MKPPRLRSMGLLACLNIFSTVVYAQSSGESLYKIGKDYFDRAQYDSALIAFTKAEVFFKAKQNWEQAIESMCMVGTVFFYTEKNAETKNTLASALALCQSKLPHKTLSLARVYEVYGKFNNDNLSDYKKSKEYFEKALEIRLKILGEESIDVAENYYLIGTTEISLGEMSDAKDNFIRSIGLKKKIKGKTDISLYSSYINMGFLYERTYEYDTALNYLDSAMYIWETNNKPPDHPRMADLFVQKGIVLKFMGKYEEALKSLEKSVKIAIKGKEGIEKLADAYGMISDIYMTKGELELALEYSEKVKSLMDERYDPENNAYVAYYINSGILYKELKRYDQAITQYKKALPISLKGFGKNHPYTSALYINLSSAYFEKGDYDQALEPARKALAIDRSLYAEPHDYIGESYTNVANIYYKMNKADSSFYYFKKAVAQFDTHKKKNIQMADPINNLAMICNYENKYKEALRYCDLALTYCGLDIPKGDPYALPTEETLTGIYQVPAILTERGKALKGLYKSEHNFDALKAALTNYAVIADLNRKLIRENKLESSKIDGLIKIIPAYHQAIDCAIDLFNETKDERYNARAFGFAEESKAILMLLNLTESNAKKYAGIPDSLISLEEYRKQELTDLTGKLLLMKENEAYQNDSVYTSLKNQHFKKVRDLEILVAALKDNYPDYYRLKYSTEPPDINLIRSHFLQNKNHALINYVVSETSVYIFLITFENFKVVKIKNPPALRKNAFLLHALLSKTNSSPDQYFQIANGLYEDLFSPLEPDLKNEGITRITIVPDDYIFYIPFEVLVKSENTKDTDFTKLPYLIHDYNFNYQYAASLTIEREKQKKEKLNKIAIGFAPDFSNIASKDILAYNDITRDRISVLDGAREELKRLGNMFSGDFFMDDFATETKFKELASQYRIIHLATHAIVDDENPDLSRLIFSHPDNDTLDDGNLFGYELYNMKLNAELVTLSACNTGFGKLQKGEGLMSLARGFAYAGCPNVVMCLWPASDNSTALLMEYFYEGIRDGRSKDEALQQAKLKYLSTADPLEANPYYWSSFVFLGDPAPLQVSTRFSLRRILPLLVLLSLAVLIVVLIKRYKKNKV